MPPRIRADQPDGAGSGVAGNARDGIWLDQEVELVDVGEGTPTSRFFTLDDKPVGSAAALAGATTSTATFTPDVPGTYKYSLAWNGDVDNAFTRVLRVTRASDGTPVSDVILPANGETAEMSEGISGQGVSGKGWSPLHVAAHRRFLRLTADEFNPSYLGWRLLAWYHRQVGVVLGASNEVLSWDDVRGPTGYGPQLTPPTASHRPHQLVAGGPIVFDGDDSPLLYDGLDAAAPAAWIGMTELTLVLVARPLTPIGDHWGAPGWGVAHLLTLGDVIGTDGLGILGNTEAYEASGVNALQGLGQNEPQALIASANAFGKSFRQGAIPAQEATVAMTAVASGARLRMAFEKTGGGVFYPACMEVHEAMVVRGRL